MEVLRPLTRLWMAKIRKAIELKKTEFQDDADEAFAFFDGPHDFMYTGRSPSGGSLQLSADDNMPRPTFRMSCNKVAEMVQIFGPYLYHRNPNRQVSARDMPDFPFDLLGADPQDPALQQFAQQMQYQRMLEKTTANFLQYYLNWTPNELGLGEHSREAIDESLIKGMGVLWHEIYQPPGSPIRMMGSFFESVDNVVYDPDAESRRDALWMCRRRVRPKWQIEQERAMPRDTLRRGGIESMNMQAEVDASGDDYLRKRGDSNDLLVYWECYSRMGMGHLMKGQESQFLDANREVLDSLGRYCYLEVCEDQPMPLNLTENVVAMADVEEIRRRVQWPTPFWSDPTDPWPCSVLAFHDRPRKLWPMSHVKPGLGELKFINWVFSFLADKVKNTSRDFIAIDETASEELKSAILSGRDLTVLELKKSHAKTIQDVVGFLQHPPMNRDIMEVVQFAMQLFEQRVGLSPLMYGETPRQMRSASEAQVKTDQLRLRPEDMARKVEAFMTMVARKEAIGVGWHMTTEDVAPVLGKDRASLWAKTVQATDPQDLVFEFNYRIEANSIRKPNRERDMENLNQALQMWTPVWQMYVQMTGDWTPFNAMAEEWAKVFNFEPMKFLMLQPPQPPPGAEEQQQMAMQQAQMELQGKAAEMQMKLQQGQQQHQQKLQQSQEQHQQKLQQTAEQSGVGMMMDAQEHRQELTQDQQRHLMELVQARQEGSLDLLLKRQMSLVEQEVARKRATAVGNGKPKQE